MARKRKCTAPCTGHEFSRTEYKSPECDKARPSTKTDLDLDEKVYWDNLSPETRDRYRQQLYEFWILLKQCERENELRYKG